MANKFFLAAFFLAIMSCFTTGQATGRKLPSDSCGDEICHFSRTAAPDQIDLFLATKWGALIGAATGLGTGVGMSLILGAISGKSGSEKAEIMITLVSTLCGAASGTLIGGGIDVVRYLMRKQQAPAPL